MYDDDTNHRQHNKVDIISSKIFQNRSKATTGGSDRRYSNRSICSQSHILRLCLGIWREREESYEALTQLRTLDTTLILLQIDADDNLRKLNYWMKPHVRSVSDTIKCRTPYTRPDYWTAPRPFLNKQFMAYMISAYV